MFFWTRTKISQLKWTWIGLLLRRWLLLVDTFNEAPFFVDVFYIQSTPTLPV